MLCVFINAGKPRGYAFIEFDSKRDMNEAWNTAEGMKIEGRRITVDVEKGRTVDDWCVKFVQFNTLRSKKGQH